MPLPRDFRPFRGVTRVSLWQASCPDRLPGRMNAGIRFPTWARCRWVRWRATRWVAAAGMVLSAFRVVLSPLRSMRDLPVITSLDRHG
ncbi:hypothetical protein FHX81_2603 [Saccharothrix saharensis]|uniref:Uncharacterized protein n=1 Tax=Saccharothrix saharensis TaxID=571190 RepID=A0A543JBQ3_9PSEU|nr:hypothetical protein [Saccharothrix saharensis]TQM80275.1 hypothetical protein FHX81_2603 [Saccharothrix saharensis]